MTRAEAMEAIRCALSGPNAPPLENIYAAEDILDALLGAGMTFGEEPDRKATDKPTRAELDEMLARPRKPTTFIPPANPIKHP